MNFKLDSVENRMKIASLTWPIFVETLLRSALSVTDTFMLSGYSDAAVSAVGVISQIVFFLVVISIMVSSGTGILITQSLGAKRKKDAQNVGVASLILGCFIGLVLSVVVVFSAPFVVSFFGLEPDVAAMSLDYLLISGAFTFNLTISIVITTILRSYGFTKSPMLISLFAGILNVIGNYIALYQPFGIPVFGVKGVAAATVISQVVTTLCLIVVLLKSRIRVPLQKWRFLSLSYYKRILAIGVLNGGEVLSYNLAQIVLVYIVAQIGTSSLAAFTYAQSITRITFTFALALGQATQIQVSFYVGRGWFDKIYNEVNRYYWLGMLTSICAISLVVLFRESLIVTFTENDEIMTLLSSLLLLSILVESGRVGNLIYISALKGAGDVGFPVKVGIFTMWGLSVTLGYFLGIQWQFGVLGVWLAISIDEWVRSIIMLMRWRSKAWF